MESARQLRILLVDDDEVDRMAVTRGLSRSSLSAEVRVARDGQEALDLLRVDKESSAIWPHMLLLDLSMPRLDGHGFLQHLRADPLLRQIVVVVLSTSDSEQDKLAAYDHCVAAYVVKRDAGRNFQGLIELLDAYWNIVSFPVA